MPGPRALRTLADEFYVAPIVPWDNHAGYRAATTVPVFTVMMGGQHSAIKHQGYSDIIREALKWQSQGISPVTVEPTELL